MNEIERIANLVVWRGVGFASLAIGTSMLGAAFDIALAAKIGAAASLLTSGVLLWKAQTFHRRPVKETEVWIMLRPEMRPPPEVAQRLICRAMRKELLQKSRYALNMGAGMLAAAIIATVAAALNAP